MNEKKQLSVVDIARLAGTSVTTVSRVINQNGRFSKETEEKVLSIIRQYNYQPNQMARSLRGGQSRVIGILVPDISSEYYSSMTKEIQTALLAEDYLAIICNTDENIDEANKFLKFFRSQKIDGLVYIGNNEIDVEGEMPTIYIDRDPREQSTHQDSAYVIECDNYQGGYLAGKELVKKGAKRPGFVCYDLRIPIHQRRLQGFRSALSEAGIPLPENCIISRETLSSEQGEDAAKQLLNAVPDTDGIFVATDIMAYGALNYLRDQGKKVPEDIRLVGFDDISTSRLPKLTTVRQPMDQMGRLAAEWLIRILSGKKIHARHVRIPVELVVRETT